MRSFMRFFICLTLVFWGQFVFAVDYFWTSGYHVGTNFPSAQAACQAIKNDFTGADSVTAVFYTPSNAKCRLVTNGSVYDGIEVFRYGDSCPVDSIYNSQTGECESPEPDQCESTSGQTTKHEYKYTGHDSDGNPTPDPPPVCKDGCRFTNDFGSFSRRRDSSNPDSFIGYFNYRGTGTPCNSDPSAPPDPPAVPPVNDQPRTNEDNRCTEWTTNSDGTSTRTCNSTKENDKPGPVKCTSTNCSAGNPPTQYDKTDKTENTNRDNKPDGSTTTTTTTTTTNTNCKGSSPCNTTDSTQTNTSGTNPDGTPGDSTTECIGSACKPSSGTGEDGEEEPEEELREATIGSCDAPASCTGDAIDCAVLQEEKTQRCLAEDQADYPKYASEIESQLSEEKYQLESEDVIVPGLLQGSTRFLPSSCPAPRQVSLSSGTNISIEFDLFCSFASSIAPIIVALALLFGALYVGRSFGGD